MAFMRSNYGIQNYAFFKNAVCTIYIEGRSVKGKMASNKIPTFDEFFYQSILAKIRPDLKFSIKVVGCKNDVLAYADRIEKNNIKNAFAVVDKDHEGILSSILMDGRVVRTWGYSWENDFWSRSLCFQILKDVVAGQGNAGRNEFYGKYRRVAHRLSRISKIDLLSKIHGKKFIPSNENSVGLNVDGRNFFGVSIFEIRKLKYPDKMGRASIIKCDVVGEVYKNTANVPFGKIIRGHLWEHACIQLIACAYKERSGEKSLPNNLVKNLSFSRFSENPKLYLSKEIYSHYARSFKVAAKMAGVAW